MKRKAYTLAEIVIVMIIASVIAGISIKIGKQKLDSIISVHYYTAYTTLDNVVKEMIYNFDPDHVNGDYLKNAVKTSYTSGGTTTNCANNEEYDSVTSSCVKSKNKVTLPRTGENFCKVFESYVNTSPVLGEKYYGSTFKDCQGSSISGISSASSEGFFSDTKKPDIILRNGMRIYNLKSEPVTISELSSENTKDSSYTKPDGTTELYIPETGYTIYIDLDGYQGSSTLWEDVYPFYITMDGRVIPAYTTRDGVASGGNSKFHLQVSIYDEYGPKNNRKAEWREIAIPFRQAVCSIDKVKNDTPYCSGITKVECNKENCTSDIKAIKRVKFLGY